MPPRQKRSWRAKSGTRSAPSSIRLTFPLNRVTPAERSRARREPAHRRRRRCRRHAASARDAGAVRPCGTPRPRLLSAYRSGRVPHAVLIAGPPGIGKATLAYRMARFVLAHPDPAAPRGAGGSIAFRRCQHIPVARRIAAQAQPDLLVIERTVNDKGVLAQADRGRRYPQDRGVFRLDRGRGRLAHRHCRCGRRIEHVRRQCAVEVLEEPPERALLLLVSHSRGAGAGDVALALSHRHAAAAWRRPMSLRRSPRRRGRTADDAEVVAAAAAADGARGAGLGLPGRRRARSAAAGARSARPAAGDRCQGSACARRSARRHRSAAARRLHRYRQCLAVAAADARAECAGPRPARLAEACESINRAARDAETYNLERKPLVFSVFGLLAEATRG